MIEKLAIILFDLGLFVFYLIIAYIIIKIIDFVFIRFFKIDIITYTCKKIKKICDKIENYFNK